MKFVFLMDPLHTVVMEKDTAFILMLGAHRRGHQVYFVPDGGITLNQDRLVFHTEEVVPRTDKDAPFEIKGAADLTADEVDAVFIRNDPPFDEQYLINTWLLEHFAPGIPVINNPAGIRTVNEKIWAAQFTDLIPPTMIGRKYSLLREFLQTHKEIIAKPTNSYGGQSIFYIKTGDPNTNVIFETLTAGYTRDIILQKFIPESREGDKRVILLNGEPLGAVLRLHSEEDHRNNFMAGGKPHPADISAREKDIIEALKPHLRKLGLYFVGIDLIGGYLIEVNVTSPTCLQEINRLSERHVENDVIEFVENLTRNFSKGESHE